MIKKIAFVAMMFLVSNVMASPAPLGIFSDLRCIAGEGDVVGTQITLMADGDQKKYVLIQWAEGVLEAPQLHKVTEKNHQLSWQIDFMGQTMKFTGKVTDKGLKGRWSAPLNQDILLPKAESFWHQAYKSCFGG